MREMLSAYLFGDSSGIYDAFITAWRVPNLFRRFLGEGALSTSLQTALTEVDGDQGLDAGRRLFQETLWLVTWVLFAICALVMVLVTLVPAEMPWTGWAWLGEDPAEVRELTVRVMPFCLLICLSAAVGGALQVRGHFGSPAWAPAIFNVAWIGTLLAIGSYFGFQTDLEGEALAAHHFEMTKSLAWGVLGAGVIQLFVQVPALLRTGLIGRVRQGAASGVQKALSMKRSAGSVLKTSAPLALGAAVYQVNVMVDGLMAESLLPPGGPTLHYYANRLQQFPLALIAIAATSAVFPSLKALGHRGQLKELRSLHDSTQLAISFVALPASLGLFLLAQPIVQVSLEHGAFGAEGVRRTSDALRALSLAILPAGATGLVARTYYALGDFRTPVQVSIVALTLNVALNVVFIVGFGFDVSGLAWATAITSWGGLFGLLVL
ncbi:MAG: murein biosynthesis integral membrane protein MurJ, partial [Planctomycetota bacterium]